MRALVAFDKFKDALSARQACEVAAAALARRQPDWAIELCPLTDGGEGFMETLTAAAGGRTVTAEVTGPRGQKLTASVGLVRSRALTPAARDQLGLGEDITLGLVGLASASGLELLPRDQRDPWQASTAGTGELMALAVRHGADALLVGLGGSATNDAGFGALTALGLRALGADGTPVAAGTPATWAGIVRLEGRLTLPRVLIACDVTNPLLGPRGATATFGPQKGLAAGDVARLEVQVARLAGLLCDHFGQPHSLVDVPGTGAAGGFGFGLMAGAGARLVPGFDLVAAWLDLPARLAGADVVLTGEGRFDATSLEGKGPGSLVREARRLGKHAHVFAGSLGLPPAADLHAITPAGMPLAEALPRSAELLAAAVARAF